MKHKVAIIGTYFHGQFPNYMQLFLNSCGQNPDFNWLIFTDKEMLYRLPKNVKWIPMTFEEFKEKTQAKFDFKISLEAPYKLCDYKPIYGYILQDYIREFDFWGHTDFDVIYGQLGKFVTDEMLDQYDKLFLLGHFTLYKNTKEILELFKNQFQGRLLYKEALSSQSICNFDEDWNGILNINDIFREKNKKIYTNPNNESKIADIYTKSSDFRVTALDVTTKKDIIEPRTKQIFAYEDGMLVRYCMTNNTLNKDEYMYIHLQKRQMKLQGDVNTYKNFTIIPNAFKRLDGEITAGNFKAQRVKYPNLHYFRIRTKNLIIKTKRLINQGKI